MAIVDEQHLDTLALPGRDDEFRALSVADRRLVNDPLMNQGACS
jgi:hypothetical protein